MKMEGTPLSGCVTKSHRSFIIKRTGRPLARLSMRKVLEFLERQPPRTILGLSFLLVSIIGLIDSLSGPEISLSVFYLIPIVLTASYVDLWAGIVMSLASVIVFFIADRILSVSYYSSAIPYWN